MQTGWVDPMGNFYPCKMFDHIEVAMNLVDTLKLGSITMKYNADEILLENGWVQITRHRLYSESILCGL